MRIRLLRFGVVVALLTAFPVSIVQAQEQQPTGGITVAPANVTLELPKGATTQETAIGIRNNSVKSARLSAAIQGLQQATDGSFGPSEIIDPGVAKSLSVDQTEFSLEPGKSLNLKLQLRDNPELTPGGHYASLFIREVQSTGQNLVLSQAVSIRVFVIKETGAVRALSVNEVRDNGGLFRVPSVVTVRFANTGNVAVAPRASIGVYDPRGRLVQSGVVNTESVTVLPTKQANLQARLIKMDRSWIPGKYKVEITYRYEGSDEHLTGVVSVFVMPPLFMGLLAAGLGLLAVLGWVVWRFWPHRRGTFSIKTPEAVPKKRISSKKSAQRPMSDIVARPKPVGRRPRRIEVKEKSGTE